MKKILIISDTHSHLDDKLIKYIEQADEVWHGGDIGNYDLCRQIEKLKPLRAVWGNIDGTDLRKTYQEHLFFMCEDVKVYITHIAGPIGKYNPKVPDKLEIRANQLNLFGNYKLVLDYSEDKKESRPNWDVAGGRGWGAAMILDAQYEIVRLK